MMFYTATILILFLTGDVVHSYNSADDIESWEGQHQIDIKLSDTTLKSLYKYMFQKVGYP